MRDNPFRFPAAGRGVMGSPQLDQVTPDHLYKSSKQVGAAAIALLGNWEETLII